MNELENRPAGQMSAAERLNVLEAEIKVFDAQVRTAVLGGACEIGKRLIEVKNLLPHGRFGQWLGEHTAYSERSAQNMMKLYEEYGREPNQRALEGLSISQAVALLAAPEEIREELIESGAAEEMSVRELKDEIRRQKDEIAARQTRIDALEAEKNGLAKEKGEKEKEIAAAQRSRDAAVKTAEGLREERAALQRELDAARNTPQEILQIEVVPPELEQELAQLRERARSAPDRTVILARDAYQRAAQEIEKLTVLLAEMPPEHREQYRPAFVIGIQRMQKKLEAVGA